MTGKEIISTFKTVASRWSNYNVPRLGASLAFYTLLSLAPLLVLVVTICGVVFKKTAEVQLLEQVGQVIGAAGAKTVKMLLDSAHQPGSGFIASMIATVTLLFGASGVFVELRDSLNTIWDAPKQSSTWRAFIWQRAIAFGMVLALGFLLLVSLILSAGLAIVEKFFGGWVPLHLAVVGKTANGLISIGAISILFALIFKFVPNVRIAWRDVIIGAFATSFLFSVGRGLLALYLSTVGVGSTYGAAGSLVALIVWVYYSAQIFFFGAVFTKVYADCFGSLADKAKNKPKPIVPNVSSAFAGQQ